MLDCRIQLIKNKSITYEQVTVIVALVVIL